MRLSEAFPSAFIKATDLERGREYPVTIETAGLEDVQDGERKERKLCLGFRGAEKRLVLNVTNSQILMGAFGDCEVEYLLGKRIVLFQDTTTFMGKPVPCVRVKVPDVASSTPPADPEPPADSFTPPAPEDDDVPF